MSWQREAIASIRLMKANGDRLELPCKRINNFTSVRRMLLGAGGVYKKNGFVFENADPAEVQRRLTIVKVTT